MADSVRTDSGSPERVAYDLWAYLQGSLPRSEGRAAIEAHLELYKQCLATTRGGRYDLSSFR